MRTPTLLLLITVASASLAQGQPATVALVSAEEAARPDAPPRLVRGLFPGPTIRLAVPSESALGQPLRSPLHLRIEFVPHNGSRVDPSSVRMTYLKSPMVDLTPRIAPAVAEQGIDLAQIALPPGHHSFQISATDSNGNRGVAVYTLSVAK